MYRHWSAVCVSRGYVLSVALFVALAVTIAIPTLAAQITGKVINVADGDTLTVLVDKTQVRVRLDQIDAPEKAQPFGTRSRESLHALCHGQHASIETSGKDRYGRTIGRVSCNGVDANVEQVSRGMAWVYDRYARDKSLYAVQDAAKSAKRGLWRDPAPVPPWDWRARSK